MPNKYGKKSKEVRATLDPRLQDIFDTVLEYYDHSLVEGHRPYDRQEELYTQGKTKVRGGKSKHNNDPSTAVDASPYPIPEKWGRASRKEWVKFYHFAGFVMAVAIVKGVKLRWGGDWDGDKDFDDQTFDDLVHFEIDE